MLFTLVALIFYLVLGLVGGTVTELVANRRVFYKNLPLPRLTLVAAILVAFGGAVVGAWLFAEVFGFKEPRLLDVPIIPALLGLLIFMVIWWVIRAGRLPTDYNKNRTWQRNFKR